MFSTCLNLWISKVGRFKKMGKYLKAKKKKSKKKGDLAEIQKGKKKVK